MPLDSPRNPNLSDHLSRHYLLTVLLESRRAGPARFDIPSAGVLPPRRPIAVCRMRCEGIPSTLGRAPKLHIDCIISEARPAAKNGRAVSKISKSNWGKRSVRPLLRQPKTAFRSCNFRGSFPPQKEGPCKKYQRCQANMARPHHPGAGPKLHIDCLILERFPFP